MRTKIEEMLEVPVSVVENKSLSYAMLCSLFDKPMQCINYSCNHCFIQFKVNFTNVLNFEKLVGKI